MHPEELQTAASAANTTSALCVHKQHANAKLAKDPDGLGSVLLCWFHLSFVCQLYIHT